MENNWLPNWKREEEYPNNDASAKEWAWEFLRRNENYQKDYEILMNFLKEIGFLELVEKAIQNRNTKMPKKAEGKISTAEISTKASKAMQDFCNNYKIVGYGGEPDPALSAKSQAFDFMVDRLRVCDRPKRVGYIQSYVDKENASFDLLTLGGIPVMIESMDKVECEENKAKPVKTKVRPTDLIVAIDLTGNIKDQMNIISSLARAQQKQLSDWGIYKNPRNRPEEFRLYLRILDALADGIDQDQIGEIFWPDDTEGLNRARTRKAEQAIKRGQEIRDFDYLRICKMPMD